MEKEGGLVFLCFSVSRDCTGNCASSSRLPGCSPNKSVPPEPAELAGPMEHASLWLQARTEDAQGPVAGALCH